MKSKKKTLLLIEGVNRLLEDRVDLQRKNAELVAENDRLKAEMRALRKAPLPLTHELVEALVVRGILEVTIHGDYYLARKYE